MCHSNHGNFFNSYPPSSAVTPAYNGAPAQDDVPFDLTASVNAFSYSSSFGSYYTLSTITVTAVSGNAGDTFTLDLTGTGLIRTGNTISVDGVAIATVSGGSGAPLVIAAVLASGAAQAPYFTYYGQLLDSVRYVNTSEAAPYSRVINVAVDYADGNDTSTNVTVSVQNGASLPTLDLFPAGADTLAAVGADVQVNSTTASTQYLPQIARFANGDYLVTWTAYQDSSYDIYAQRYAANGTAQGGEFRVNATTLSDQANSVATVLDSGDYVIAWRTYDSVAGAYNFVAQRFSAAGVAQGGEVTLASGVSDVGEIATITGGFVAVWTDADASGNGVFAQRFSATGVAQGSVLAVNASTASTQYQPAVTRTTDGFTITWASAHASTYDIYLQRFLANGSTVGSETLVNTFLTATEQNPAITQLQNGTTLVAWTSTDGSGYGIYARLFAANGSALTPEFVVNSTTAGSPQPSNLLALADGGFVLLWTSPDGSGQGVFARRFDANGNALSGQVRVSGPTFGDQFLTYYSDRSLVQLPDGSIVVTYMNFPYSTYDYDVFTRRLQLNDGLTLDSDTAGLVAVPIALGWADSVDGSETLVLTLSGFPAGSTFNQGAAGAGNTWVINVTDPATLLNLVLDPPQGYAGSFTMTASATTTESANGATATSAPLSIDVTVVYTNSAPVAVDDTLANTGEDTAVTYTAADLTGNDTDTDNDPLSISSVSNAVGGTVSLNANGSVTFTPTANYHGPASFDYVVSDGQGGTDTGSASFDVTSVNDAPSGSNATLTINEDAPRTLTAADFGFGDVDGNSLAAVRITTLPTAGTLTLNGNAVTAGQSIPVASLPQLVFTPALNANGTGIASFTFQVQDNGGTANGGVDLDPTANTITFDVTPVNDAPSGSNATLIINEDAPRTLTAADFGFGDVDGNSLAAVRITTLPAAGTLTLNGNAVTAGQSIPVASLPQLVFTPALNANGTGIASFTFQVQDNGGTANGGVDLDPTANTITFDVTSVNDAPSGSNATLTINEDTPRTLTAADFGFGDVDGNSLAAVRIATLPTAGTLTLNGNAVTAGQSIPVASLPQLVFTPALNANGTGIASFTFQVQDNGGTASGGVDLDPTANTITFNVTPVNDAPTLANPIADQAATEDAAFSFTLPANSFADVDLGDTLSYSVSALPSWLSFDAATRTFSGMPGNADVGFVDVTVTATDTGNASASDVIRITVANTNDAPDGMIIVGNGPRTLSSAGDIVVGQFLGRDVDVGDTLTYSLTGATNSRFLVDAATGVLTFNYDRLIADPGALTQTVYAAVTDSAGAVFTASFGIDLSNLLAAGAYYGTADADFISLAGGKDEIYAREGNDVVHGNLGDDTVYGEDGDDMLFGEEGDDRLIGQNGDDQLFGGAGRNELRGGAGNDIYVVESGSDTIIELAGQGTDEVRTALGVFTLAAEVENLTFTGGATSFVGIGNASGNVIVGGTGRDQIAGLDGDDTLGDGGGVVGNEDTLIGGRGNDTYLVALRGDSIVEYADEGIDEVRTALRFYSLAANVENLTFTDGTPHNAFGNAGDNILTGNTGRDELQGLDGNDTLSDGGGVVGNEDTLIGGTGNDTYLVTLRGDSVIEYAGEGTDEVRTSLGVYVLSDHVEILTFTDDTGHAGVGSAQDNMITGGTGGDELNGLGGNDTIVGGSGAANTLLGGTGDDLFIVTASGDSVIEYAGEGTDTVQTTLSVFYLRDNVENLVFTGTGSFSGIGSSDNNTLTAGAGADFLSGNDGNDILIGGSGADLLIGGNGADQFRYLGGETGYDRIIDFVAGTDKIALASAGFAHTATLAFVSGAGAVANSANSTFLYDTNTGIVSYDADGNGAGEAVQLAQLDTGLTLTVGDFVFV